MLKWWKNENKMEWKEVYKKDDMKMNWIINVNENKNETEQRIAFCCLPFY